jgi:AraC-like DNA-binding protein
MFHLAPELFLQKGGATEFSCPEDRFTLRSQEVAIIPRGVPHGEIARERRGSPFRTLVFCFHGNELTLLVSKSSPESQPLAAFCDEFEGIEVPQALRYLEDAAAASLKASPTGEARRRALVFATISVVHDLLGPARLAHRTPSNVHPKVRHCHDLIQALLAEPRLSVTSLARQLGCTPDHLSRCFRAETGLPVAAYIRHQRLARAKDLLQDPKLNISEIAWACGFSSLNYFVRAFRQTMGQPPRQFQRTLAPAARPREP